MSGYEKPRETFEYGYDASTRPPNPGSIVGGYIQPTPAFETQQPSDSHPLAPAYLGGAPQQFVARDEGPLPPTPTPGHYVDSGRTRFQVEITSHGPYHGVAGEKIRITFRSLSDLNLSKFNFNLLLGSYCLKSSAAKTLVQQPYHHYSLLADIPNFGSPGQSTMPLVLQIQDENAYPIEDKALGNFLYSSQGSYSQYPALGERRKRKFSDDSSFLQQPAPKRSASQPLQAKLKDSPSLYPTGQMHLQTESNYPALYSIPQLGRSTPRQYGQITGQREYEYSMSPSLAPQSLKMRSPSLGYASYATSASQASQSPRLASASHLSLARLSKAPPSQSSSNPGFVRTTILKPPTPVSRPAYPTAPHSFNPYNLYPNAKANLVINGDLMSMCEGWTPDESGAKRRLVEFERSQSGSTITTDFKPVTKDTRSPNNPCISCILWERKRQCFVTSVDTIALLEALVAVRFTVEEKNRIRRNLEGFKPYTVSKAKDECDDIFRLIMGFQDPKPRNIEKDIKIFPWSILGPALKKIIGKYSASYASTSAIIPPPAPSTYGSSMSEVVERQHHHQQAASSPESTTSSGATNAFHGGMTSTAMSPSLGPASIGSAGLDVMPGAAVASHLGAWQTHYPSQYVVTPSTVGRQQSWDYSGYVPLEPSSMTTGVNPALTTYYRATSGSSSQTDPTQPTSRM